MGAPEEYRYSIAELIGRFLSTRTRAARLDIHGRLLAALAPDTKTPRARRLSEADFTRFAAAQIEIGNHTASHVHLRALTADERGPEIAGAKARLEALSGQRVRAFSIPYGDEQDAPPEILAAIRDSGHQATFVVHGRSNAFRKVSDVWYRVSFNASNMKRPSYRAAFLPFLKSFKSLISEQLQGAVRT
jgi:hypothetical protein